MTKDRLADSTIHLIRGVRLAALFLAACGHPPEAKAPEREAVAYDDFAIDPVTPGSETQEKGQVVVQAVPLSMAAVAHPVRRCRFATSGSMLQNLTNKSGQENSDYYEVRTSKQFVSPDRLTFSLKVTNRLSQVLKLDSAVIRLNADDKDVSADNADFTQGVLVPGEQKEYKVTTDAWRRFSPNASVHFGIYGMPVEMDASGGVSKRENFEWSFTFRKQEKIEQVEVPVAAVLMTESQARACN